MNIRLFALAVLAGVTVHADILPPEKVYGREFIETLRRATEVEAQKVLVDLASTSGSVRTVTIKPTGSPYVLNAGSKDILKRAFLKGAEADQATKLCAPVPGLRYQFRSNSGTASVLVCYKCRIALIERDGHVLREAYVDEIIADLRKVAESFLSPEEVAKLP